MGFLEYGVNSHSWEYVSWCVVGSFNISDVRSELRNTVKVTDLMRSIVIGMQRQAVCQRFVVGQVVEHAAFNKCQKS